MRHGLLLFAASAVLGGCAASALSPARLAERREAGSLVAALEAYNAGPSAVRAWGDLRGGGPGRADFGATVVEGEGLRFDAVAGPFSTPLFALACRSGVECRGYWPSRGVSYVDAGGGWERLLAAALRGRVPILLRPVTVGAWTSARQTPVLILSGDDGWEERVEFLSDSARPERVFLWRGSGRPLAVLQYEEFGPDVEGRPFPGRLRLRLTDPERDYELSFRRVEPVTSGVDPSLFALSVPSGTVEERVEGAASWTETVFPPWLSPPQGPSAHP